LSAWAPVPRDEVNAQQTACRHAAPAAAPRQAPWVTALVPVYNGERYLAMALDSALAQTYSRLEVIVVIDGATDESGRVAERYCAASNDRIRVIVQANHGLPAARNTAIAAARGEYLALLDADDVWLPHHIESAVAVLEADPSVGLVHGNVRCIDEDGAPAGVYTRRWSEQRDVYRALALRHDHVVCPTAVFRRDCVDRLGGFDLRFTGYGCEDRDLWLRIAESWSVHYIDDFVALYRVHAGSMSQNEARMAEARRLLVEKFAVTPRGAPLARHAEAMIQSDLGMEYLEQGAYARALLAQCRALRIRPQSARIWRRTLRPALCLVSATIFGI
jgi:glycosyltransferase involved in cell wall biosynthesis